MTLTLIPVLALSVVIGLSLGVLGGGGSILTVPILVYVAGFEAKEAIAASLFVVGVTSAVSVLSHARGGRVMWRTGLIFGASGMAGAFVGGLLGGHIPGQILLIAFAVMMLATSVTMLRGRKKKYDDGAAPVRHELALGRVLLDGAVVGLITGLVGAGGGFLVVPALALLGGLPMSVAVGTSLVTYVGMLEEMGALKELEAGIAGLGSASLAALITSYVVAIVSAFASTTGTLGVISPVVEPIAMDPLLTPIGVVTAIAISSSVVDVSPMSTSGALLMASAQPKEERMFFRALLVWAIAMIAVVPLLVWFVFVQLGLG